MTPESVQIVDPYRRNAGTSPGVKYEPFTFADALDVVNPLQHIPIVNLVYREMSGDEISAPAAVAGGALYGGVLGFAGSLLAAAFESLSGESAEEALTRVFSPKDQAQGLAAYERASGLAKS
jgi:hypothetical protein